jgi:predicted enzyme related to lactoylglutathione lyase
LLAQSPAKGAAVAEKIQPPDCPRTVGRFGRVTDPEGNRVKLWQPS